MTRMRIPYFQASSITRMNDAPMNSPNCVEEMRRLEEFLQKRFPQQRAYLTATSDFAQAAENSMS